MQLATELSLYSSLRLLCLALPSPHCASPLEVPGAPSLWPCLWSHPGLHLPPTASDLSFTPVHVFLLVSEFRGWPYLGEHTGLPNPGYHICDLLPGGLPASAIQTLSSCLALLCLPPAGTSAHAQCPNVAESRLDSGRPGSSRAPVLSPSLP